MSQQSAKLSLYKFHLGIGGTVSLWAEGWKEAIQKFRGMNPGLSFMTDVEFKNRKHVEVA